jgi:hypothetical protein
VSIYSSSMNHTCPRCKNLTFSKHYSKSHNGSYNIELIVKSSYQNHKTPYIDWIHTSSNFIRHWLSFGDNWHLEVQWQVSMHGNRDEKMCKWLCKSRITWKAEHRPSNLTSCSGFQFICFGRSMPFYPLSNHIHGKKITIPHT